MSFKSNLVATAAACAVVSLAQPAMAADFLPGTNNPGTPSAFFNVDGDPFSGAVSATFGRSGLPVGTFTDQFLFTLGQDGLGSGTISTSLAGPAGGRTDLDFLNVMFSNDGGMSFVPISIFTNVGNEFGGLSNIPITAGIQNILSVEYRSRGAGAFGGDLTFQPFAAVPEPATWALMLLGFGAIGFSMRRRKDKVRVRYAF